MERKEIEAIYNYFRSSRRCGHTTLAKEATKDKGYVVFPTIKDGKLQQCQNAISPLEMSRFMGREYKPTILDNHTVLEMCIASLRAFDEVSSKSETIEALRDSISQLKSNFEQERQSFWEKFFANQAEATKRHYNRYYEKAEAEARKYSYLVLYEE
jgi:hypothetical protein